MVRLAEGPWAWIGTSALWFGFGALLSGLILSVVMRRHLAWPLLLALGLGTLHGGGWLPSVVLVTLALLAAGLACGVAALHVYWAFAGTKQPNRAVPSLPNGEPLFSPGPFVCIAVAVAISTLAAALVWAAYTPAPAPWILRGVLTLALLVLTLRVVGDGRFVGFSKRVRDTAFGRADDAVYTPAVVLLWFGAASALVL